MQMIGQQYKSVADKWGRSLMDSKASLSKDTFD
jgi:hypothetical protein